MNLKDATEKAEIEKNSCVTGPSLREPARPQDCKTYQAVKDHWYAHGPQLLETLHGARSLAQAVKDRCYDESVLEYVLSSYDSIIAAAEEVEGI